MNSKKSILIFSYILIYSIELLSQNVIDKKIGFTKTDYFFSNGKVFKEVRTYHKFDKRNKIELDSIVYSKGDYEVHKCEFLDTVISSIKVYNRNGVLKNILYLYDEDLISFEVHTEGSMVGIIEYSYSNSRKVKQKVIKNYINSNLFNCIIERNIYSANGNLVKVEILGNNNEITNSILNIYDSTGNLESSIYYDGSRMDSFEYQELFSYDESGKLLKKSKTYASDSIITKYQYNSSGKIVSIRESGRNETPLNIETYEYSKYGLLQKKSQFDVKQNRNETTIYKDDRIIKIEVRVDGILEMKTIYKYF